MQISKFNGNKIAIIRVINRAYLKIQNAKSPKVTWIQTTNHSIRTNKMSTSILSKTLSLMMRPPERSKMSALETKALKSISQQKKSSWIRPPKNMILNQKKSPVQITRRINSQIYRMKELMYWNIMRSKMLFNRHKNIKTGVLTTWRLLRARLNNK